jgi:alkanesulfonate monooxygenase SsuD/methylene tetrahydromethanopterin reductase-like flavin-dependent oxidoreductase (luciferase family)
MTENTTTNHHLKFGLLVSCDEPGTADPAVTLPQWIERAVTARDLGFESIAVGHHYSFGPVDDANNHLLENWRYQPLLMLAHLSAVLGNTVSYATSVLLSAPLHPVQLAEEVATLDTMCHGKLRLGLGLGWAPYEFAGLSVDYATRGRRFDELIVTYKRLMTESVVKNDGPHFPIPRGSLVAHGISRPMPPLWIGASGDAAVRRAARLGDAWVMSGHMDVDELARQQKLFDRTRSEYGLPAPKEAPIVRIIALSEDRDQARRDIQPLAEEWVRRRGDRGWSVARKGDLDAVERTGTRFIVGDPDDCVKHIETIKEQFPITEVLFVIAYPNADQETRLKMIELIGREVIPRLNK